MRKNLLILLFLFHSIKAHSYEMPKYVINLDSSIGRLKKIDASFKKHSLKYERFKAINGYEVEIVDSENNKKYYGIDHKFGKFSFKIGTSYDVHCDKSRNADFTFIKLNKNHLKIDNNISAGAIGCFCSHRLVLLNAVDKNYEKFVIFEDDLRITSNNFSKILKKASQMIPHNGVVLLDSYGKSAINLRKYGHDIGEFKIIKDSLELYGTHAVLWTRDAAIKFLEKTKIVNSAVDNELAKLISNEEIKGLLYSKRVVNGGKKSESIIKRMGRPS